jgi:hypothetical protein
VLSEPTIHFGPDAVPSGLSARGRQVLSDILRAAGLSSCTVSSTARTPESQARVMLQNVRSHGVASQLRLYRAPGRAVLDALAKAERRGEGVPEILAAMVAEILKQGPYSVSHHCLGPEERSKRCVFDVAPSSISNGERFQEEALRMESLGSVSKFLRPPADPGYHLEVPERT